MPFKRTIRVTGSRYTIKQNIKTLFIVTVTMTNIHIFSMKVLSIQKANFFASSPELVGTLLGV